jgi:23S rRNA (cytosine1962-C5)-methyltransferase
MIQSLSPIAHWQDYELIDSGNFEKLERFGKVIVARPEPQALWQKALPQEDWHKMAKAYFVRAKGSDKSAEKGEWRLQKGCPEQWWMAYQYQNMHLRFRLGLTAFKHVGIFPEQAANWNFIYERLQSMPKGAKVLNLFAYTGGASLAARAAGAEVSHVDSVKQVLSWSRENMEASGLQDIRWVLEDALKYVRREAKRGKSYQGIILDPPAYGRGPDGEKWILEEHLYELLQHCAQLLDKEHYFLILNLYSMGFSSLIAENLVQELFPQKASKEIGELYLPDQAQRKLPLGVFLRMHSST